MTDKLHEDSGFVVCRACGRYFFFEEINDHQGKEHPGHEWKPEDDPYRRFYYLTNAEVAWSLNKLKEIRESANTLRILLL